LFCKLFSDEQTMRFVGPALSEKRAAHDFAAALRAAHRDPPRELFLSICDKLTEEAFGICSIQRIDPVHQRAEIGLMLQHHVQRKGFGKEVVEALTQTALATLPVVEIWAQYAADNQAAVALFNSVGFRPIRPEPADERAHKHAGHVRIQTRSLYSRSSEH
jgi:RimJ/RimL family protein N-acetyltransferase